MFTLYGPSRLSAWLPGTSYSSSSSCHPSIGPVMAKVYQTRTPTYTHTGHRLQTHLLCWRAFSVNIDLVLPLFLQEMIRRSQTEQWSAAACNHIAGTHKYMQQQRGSAIKGVFFLREQARNGEKTKCLDEHVLGLFKKRFDRKAFGNITTTIKESHKWPVS